MPTILIIDDDPDFQEFVCALFELEGYEPVAAFDGPTGLELYEQVHPDVILVDVMMPGMDGYEVSRRLREEMASETPVIFISARPDERPEGGLEEAARDDYVTKPFDFPTLLQAVRCQLGEET